MPEIGWFSSIWRSAGGMERFPNYRRKALTCGFSFFAPTLLLGMRPGAHSFDENHPISGRIPSSFAREESRAGKIGDIPGRGRDAGRHRLEAMLERDLGHPLAAQLHGPKAPQAIAADAPACGAAPAFDAGKLSRWARAVTRQGGVRAAHSPAAGPSAACFLRTLQLVRALPPSSASRHRLVPRSLLAIYLQAQSARRGMRRALRAQASGEFRLLLARSS